MRQEQIDKLSKLGRVKFTGREGNYPRMFVKDVIAKAGEKGADKYQLSDSQDAYLNRIYARYCEAQS